MRFRPLFAIAAVVLATACADSDSTPTGPVEAVDPELQNSHAPPGCPSPVEIRLRIAYLFKQPGQAAIAQLKFTAIQLAMIARKPAIAQGLMFRLVAFTLERYERGELRGGQSATTQAKLVEFIKALYCFVGLPEPDLSAFSLGPDGAAAVVLPTSPDTVVVTETQAAGISIPSGSVSTPTLVTITPLPDFPGPLNTPLDQYPSFYEFHSSSGVPFSADVIVGTCQVDDFEPYSALRIGHNVGTGIEILPLQPAPFLNCPTLSNIRSVNGWFRYVQRNGWRRGIEPLAQALLLPRPLVAATVGTCCLGGSTKKLSPFGSVDTRTYVNPASATSIVGLPGSAVPSGQLPTVRLTTDSGHPIPGAIVTFSIVTGSGGSISGVSQVTDTGGRATLGSWTLGSTPGMDTVFAFVTPLDSTTVDGQLRPVLRRDRLEHAGALPVRRLQLQAHRHAVPQPQRLGVRLGYTPTGWSSGSAAFGSGPGSPDGCYTLDSTVVTSWPTADNTRSRVFGPAPAAPVLDPDRLERLGRDRHGHRQRRPGLRERPRDHRHGRNSQWRWLHRARELRQPRQPDLHRLERHPGRRREQPDRGVGPGSGRHQLPGSRSHAGAGGLTEGPGTEHCSAPGGAGE